MSSVWQRGEYKRLNLLEITLSAEGGLGKVRLGWVVLGCVRLNDRPVKMFGNVMFV
jgi:hypothetical protein